MNFGKLAGMALVSVLAAGVLSGCSSSKKPACPRVGILSDAAELSRMRDGGSDVSDIAYQAEFSNVSLECEIGEQAIESTVKFRMIVQKGPRATGDTVSVPYFIALVTPTGGIVSKTVVDQQVSFGGQSAVQISKEVDKSLTLFPILERVQPGGLEVLIGFQLTKEEVAFNREQKAR